MVSEDQKNTGLCWFALHVKSRHEFQVYERLSKAGIETFFPTIEAFKDPKEWVKYEYTDEEEEDVFRTEGLLRLLIDEDRKRSETKAENKDMSIDIPDSPRVRDQDQKVTKKKRNKNLNRIRKDL